MFKCILKNFGSILITNIYIVMHIDSLYYQQISNYAVIKIWPLYENNITKQRNSSNLGYE